MGHANEDLIRRLYDARARDDREEIRQIVHPDVAWHDPYPPPHGGELRGLDAVFEQIFDRAGEITGGSTSLHVHDVVANDEHAVALVNWSSTIQEQTMNGREIALYHVRDGRVSEVWFYPEDHSTAAEFFA